MTKKNRSTANSKKSWLMVILRVVFLVAIWFLGNSIVIQGFTPSAITKTPVELYETLANNSTVIVAVVATHVILFAIIPWFFVRSSTFIILQASKAWRSKESASDAYLISAILLQQLTLSLILGYEGYADISSYEWIPTLLALGLCVAFIIIYRKSHEWTRKISPATLIFRSRRFTLFVVGIIGLLSLPFMLLFQQNLSYILAAFFLFEAAYVVYAAKSAKKPVGATKKTLANISNRFLLSYLVLAISCAAWIIIFAVVVFNASSPYLHQERLANLAIRHIGNKPGGEAEVMIDVNSVEANTSAIKGDVRVCISRSTIARLSPNTKELVLHIDNDNGANYFFTDTASKLDLADSSNDPLANCLHPDDYRGFMVRDVLIYGTGHSLKSYYPNDSYTFNVFAMIQVGPDDTPIIPNLYIHNRGTNSTELKMGDTGWLNGWAQATFMLQRSLISQLYIYLVALAPLIVITIVAVLVLAGKRLHDDARDYVIGVALAILAILPTRSVLVPSDIVGLTMVDYIFGLEIMSSVVLVSLYYVRTMIDSSRQLPLCDEQHLLSLTSRKQNDTAKSGK